MRKMNDLIKELQKHGMAQSSDEAAVKAEDILRLGEKIIPSNDTPVTAEQKVSRDDTQMQIDQLKRAVNNLSNELENIKLALTKKADISALSAITATQQQAQRRYEEERPQIKVQQQTAPPQEVKQESHPRQGNFTPADVSMEKFFYYGKK